jgi:uncharacterized protein
LESIFVMGATGFIGEEVVKSLQKKGMKVFGLARSKATQQKLEAMQVIPVIGDAYEPDKWINQLRQPNFSPDYVINTLGFFTDGMPARFSVAHANRCRDKYKKWMEATLALAKLPSVKGIVNVTGTTIFEDMGVGWVTEQTPVRYTPSGFNRVATPATKMFQQAIRDGVPMIVAVAPSVVYGRKPKSSFDEVFVKPLEKGQMGVVGDGKNYITTGHVVDVGAAIAHLTDKKYAGEIFLIADDQPVTQREFVTRISRALGKEKVMSMPKWLVAILGGKCAVEFMTLSQRIDNSKLKATGFTLKYPRFTEQVEEEVKSLLVLREELAELAYS